MSVGGIFQLVSNDGIQDQLIMQTEKLLSNIKKISYDRVAKLKALNPGLKDDDIMDNNEAWMPTLSSIEQSHILFVNSVFKPFVAMAHEYAKAFPRGGLPALGSSFEFQLPVNGDFVNDSVLYVKLTGLSSVSSLDKVRYYEMLGHRLMKHTEFKVSGNPIDSYTSDDYNAYYAYKVPLHKETGYLRCIGQEIPKLGYLTADPVVDEVREYKYFGDGPQTFKNVQDTVELYIPLLFWFKDINTALPNFTLPFGQTIIGITFEEQNNLIAYADYGGGGAYHVPAVAECSLYVNHLYVLPEVQQIFMTRYGFQLIRVHRSHTETLTESTKSVRLYALKWPVESIYIGFRPVANNFNSQYWYKNASIREVSIKEPVVTGTSSIQVNNAIYLDESHVVQNLSLKSFDITIYNSFAPEFYNNYIPLRYGKDLKTTKEIGWYMMNFNFMPGQYQPSGHLNVSRARELDLVYTSALNSTYNNIISQQNPVDLIVLADCINFIIYKNNAMALRFST
jgi:hypothetical protein